MWHAASPERDKLAWRCGPDLENTNLSAWGNFFMEFSEQQNHTLLYNIVDAFLRLTHRSWRVPWSELFQSGFLTDLLKSVEVLFQETTFDRHLAPYVWALSVLISSGREFCPYFENDALIDTLIKISCSSFSTSSCHALRSLMDLCSYDPHFVHQISRHFEMFLAYFDSIQYLQRNKFMCLVLIATLAPETPQWQCIGTKLADGLVFGKLELRTMYLSAINAFIRLPKCLDYTSSLTHLIEFLPTCIRDSRIDTTTEALILTYKFVRVPNLDMPFRAIIDSIATSAQADARHTILGFRVLCRLVERRIEISYIASLSHLIKPAKCFLRKSSYATKVASIELLASLIVYGDKECQTKVAQLDPFQHCSELLNEKHISSVIFDAMNKIEDKTCLKALIPELEMVAGDHENPNHTSAEEILVSLIEV